MHFPVAFLFHGKKLHVTECKGNKLMSDFRLHRTHPATQL